MSDSLLKDKVCVITGSTSGMGKAAAILFAKNGAKVVITGRRDNEGMKIAKLIGKNALFIKTDVSDESSVKTMINLVIKKWGRIDVLYNNAGIEASGTIDKVIDEEINKVFNVNIKGVMYCCKHAIPFMKKNASIINTASIAGIVGYPNLVIYGASKGAIVTLTKDLAIDCALKGIRVNAICPGVIWTDMVKRFINEAEDKEAMKKQLTIGTPLGRVGQPEEVAELALFLASEKSSFITGAVIPIDGGYTAQ